MHENKSLLYFLIHTALLLNESGNFIFSIELSSLFQHLTIIYNLCLMNFSSEIWQNLPYFCDMKTQINNGKITN